MLLEFLRALVLYKANLPASFLSSSSFFKCKIIVYKTSSRSSKLNLYPAYRQKYLCFINILMFQSSCSEIFKLSFKKSCNFLKLQCNCYQTKAFKRIQQEVI